MAVQPQYAPATADGAGEAVFMFPDVPQGQVWIGTVTIPNAPATANGTINIGATPVGPIFGPGVYGPYIGRPTAGLSLSVAGLDADTQYVAVWHADDGGEQYSTWPGTVTTTVQGTVIIPTPVDVDIVSPDPLPVSVTAPNPLPVDGMVTANQGTPGGSPWPVMSTPDLASAVEAGQVTMTGSDVTLPSHGATQGVVLSAPATNHAVIVVGPSGVTAGTGLILEPGGPVTPLLPVNNSDTLTAIGTSADVLSFLVT